GPARGDQGRLPAALPRLPRSLSRDAARARPAAARPDLLRSSAVAARRGPHRDPRPPRGRGGGIRPPAGVLIPVAYADVEVSRLGVVGEIVRGVRTPYVERILRPMVAAVPVAVGGHIVDAGRIFAETAPRIADIVEEVGAEDVAPEAPPLREPLAEHMHGASPDLVDRAHVPAQVMQPRRVRVGEGDHVMIAAVNAVQKRDPVAGPVGEAQAEHAGIELDRALDVAAEQEDMG